MVYIVQPWANGPERFHLYGAHRHGDDVRDDAVSEMLVTESDAFIDTGETA